MKRRYWHLISYDIACPKRSYRVRRRLQQKALFKQKSVCVRHCTGASMKREFAVLRGHLHEEQDDLRIYRIRHPGDAWSFGKSPLAPLAAQPGTAAGTQSGWITRLLNRLRRPPADGAATTD